MSEAASAAKFADNATLSITVPTFQINNAISLPTGEFAGGADGLADALFGTGFPSISASNRVINKNGQDVRPGVTGEFSVGSSSGGFQAYQGQTGEITSFDGTTFNELSEVNGGFEPPNDPLANPNIVPGNLFSDNFLLRLSNGTNNQLNFYLTEVNLQNSVEQILAGAPIIFSGRGWLGAAGDPGIAYYEVEYEITSQTLPDDGTRSGDPVAGDGVTGLTTLSGTSIVVTIIPTSVPEPSAMVGLAVVAGAGLFMKKKQKRA
ncbi:hypothetical protein CFPU101_24950 [Chroococcus sp. FPU101]|nr:hypothetical protein CFPU101_24950 [Chroococcus sp. FPU101]